MNKKTITAEKKEKDLNRRKQKRTRGLKHGTRRSKTLLQKATT
jgi:hypothetical protein